MSDYKKTKPSSYFAPNSVHSVRRTPSSTTSTNPLERKRRNSCLNVMQWRKSESSKKTLTLFYQNIDRHLKKVENAENCLQKITMAIRLFDCLYMNRAYLFQNSSMRKFKIILHRKLQEFKEEICFLKSKGCINEAIFTKWIDMHNRFRDFKFPSSCPIFEEFKAVPSSGSGSVGYSSHDKNNMYHGSSSSISSSSSSSGSYHHHHHHHHPHDSGVVSQDQKIQGSHSYFSKKRERDSTQSVQVHSVKKKKRN